jgi:hypothetical protein
MQNGARHGGLGQLGCRAGAARRRALDAVQVHVRHKENGRVCTREHVCALGVLWRAGRVQSEGQDGRYGRSGRLAVVG